MLNSLNKTGVSVVICTYNGKDRLEPTLSHLARQTGIAFEWEILLIDNNSNDGTAAMAADYWNSLQPPCSLRIVNEPQPGTMYARASGIKNAAYRYLLYCDDDNWLSQQYVATAFSTIQANQQIAAVGGLGILAFGPDFKIPAWLNNYTHYFGSGPQGSADGDTTEKKGCLYTAGAILDRVWLNKLYDAGFKSYLIGRDSKSLVAGEDTELTYALKLIGGKLYFNSAMQFQHFMPRGRMTWQYLVRLSAAIGYSNYLLRPYYINQQRNYLYDCLITAALVLKYYLKSVACFFKEGNANVIFYAQFKGQFGCLIKGKKDYQLLENVVNTLHSDIKN